ncbi:MAG: transcriptional repressor [Comamonas sp.]|uniref:transcriptional repressor n=1 Tax=Comamonas sp. TaxID=34028 RepID=UPI002FC7BDE3
MTKPSTPTLTLPAGMRATRAVQALLSLLPMQPPAGWTEALVEVALHDQGISVNRVTVYRALDRLTQAGLLQRTVNAQRITHYFVVDATAPTASAHLECTACHQHITLDPGAGAVQAALHALREALVQSTGVHKPMLDVAVQGECAQCAGDAKPPFFNHP